MKLRRNAKPHGELRQSQVITTFGPGSLLDLPNHSVIMGGLEHWLSKGEEVHEPRLVEKLKRLLELYDLRLYTPPPEVEDPDAPCTGMTVWQFPEWFITQDVETGGNGQTTRSRLMVRRSALTRGKYIDRDRKKRPVVPIRFVRACRRGHIDDIDWYAFVHKGQTTCRKPLYLEERGTSGDLSEVWVRCECGVDRQVIDAARMETKSLGNCDGSRPWLGPMSKEKCGEPNRLLIRTASNAYFPQMMSVISLPDRSEVLTKTVNQMWSLYLEHADSLEKLKSMRSLMPPLDAALKGFSDDIVFAELQSRKGVGEPTATTTVKQAEMQTLSEHKDELGEDRQDGTFYAKALPKSEWDQPWMEPIERVVLIHRLREVTAQVGFTRFEPVATDTDGELEIGVRRAALARETTWLPAVENRGEGIFFQFKEEAIKAWQEREAVKQRGKKLLDGYVCWRNDHEGTHRKFPGLPYIMLHSLSHLLITAVSLECGYPASSIRERIYAGEAGHGILLFTGSQDAEGTLGGLVEVGRRLGHHMREALEQSQLCSNDPVCSQHEPQNPQERRFLLGAACHGCLLIAETSCEQYNEFLDRALVVPTLDNLGAEFFQVGEV